MKRIVAAAVLAVCMIASQAIGAETKKAAPASKPQKNEAQQQGGNLTGKVVQTMNSGGYTYVQLETSGKKIWVAVTEIKISKGQTASFKPGVLMENFESKTLKRKFDKIIFSDGLASQPSGAAVEEKSGGSKDKAAKTKEKISIAKPAGANVYTVDELYKKKAGLNHKTVTVKGKIVKVSQGIMQRNWLHLQDGTGDAKKGTHNLVLTTTAGSLPSVGDVVTVTGTCYVNKDFGAGYKYDVIVENSTISK